MPEHLPVLAHQVIELAAIATTSKLKILESSIAIVEIHDCGEI
ncbi:hypothetical protein [Chamaesiphon sp.]